MQADSILPIDAAAVTRQFDRLGRRALAPAFLLTEVAKRMAERLDYIRLAPQRILDAGCGQGAAVQLLTQRYKKADFIGVDASASQLAHAAQHWPSTGLRARFRQAIGGPRITWLQRDLNQLTLPAPVDLLWTNGLLHWLPQPHTAIRQFASLIAPGGLLMLSCFGPDSFKQVRSAAAQAGLPNAVLPFVDMHDFGDMLVASRLSTPVMDSEMLTLTYPNPQALVDELRLLGGNPHAHRSPNLTGKARWQAFLAALQNQAGADGRIPLSVEVIYGHAWQPDQIIALGSNQVSLAELASTLPSRRKP